MVTKSNTIRDELRLLKDTNMLKWSEIVQIPKFVGIPKRTLSMIYLGKRDVPKKFRKQLGLPETVRVVACSACGEVHAYDRACEMQVTIKPKPIPRVRKWRDIRERDLIWALDNRHETDWSNNVRQN